jgi:hypothetical protein
VRSNCRLWMDGWFMLPECQRARLTFSLAPRPAWSCIADPAFSPGRPQQVSKGPVSTATGARPSVGVGCIPPCVPVAPATVQQPPRTTARRIVGTANGLGWSRPTTSRDSRPVHKLRLGEPQAWSCQRVHDGLLWRVGMLLPTRLVQLVCTSFFFHCARREAASTVVILGNRIGLCSQNPPRRVFSRPSLCLDPRADASLLSGLPFAPCSRWP